MVLTNWYALAVPKGTPPQIVNTIYKACEKIHVEQESYVKAQAEKLALRVAFLGPEQLSKQLQEERKNMKEIIDELMTAEKK